ncbi:MAG: histidinol-phosphate transaminase [Clostridiaceae bacterium]|nr:histidinol-phosphate transaminase [Clostridiaceae bacterium]
MSRFWSSNTQDLMPYVPGEQPKEGIFIKLNTNENPYPPSPKVIEKVKNLDFATLRLYPNPDAQPLKKAISEYYNVSDKEVFVGNGSDEVLALIFKAFFDENTTVAFPDITYSFYPVYCNLFQIPFLKVPIKDDLSIDLSDYPASVAAVIFANPNAPTGLFIEPQKIEEFLKSRPETLFVVDEAYIDFGAKSCIPLIHEYDNLLVVQTFSKSRSLAGLRVGYAIGNTSLIEGLKRVKDSFNSYPVDTIAQIAAVAALEDQDYFVSVKNRIIETREKVKNIFSQMGFFVTDSMANFLFVKIPGVSGSIALEKLRQKGILVRNFGIDRISDYLRITIGTDEEMTKVVESIKSIMAE